MPPDIQIDKALGVGDVRWPQVLELLVSRFKLPFFEANADVAHFLKRFYRPLNLYWYLRSHLSPEDNRLLALACEVEGADVLKLSHEREIHLLSFSLRYRQLITFMPAFKRLDGQPGALAAEHEVGFLGTRVVIRTAPQLLLLQAALVLSAVCLYVAVVSLLLYSVAVFLLFWKLPIHMTIAATKDAPMGLALLCFLVAAAAIFGRAIRNLFRIGAARIARIARVISKRREG